MQCIRLAGTSRRPNIATSPRRDVGSTNLKVNKWQHHDASTSRRLREFCLLSLKEKRGAKLEVSRIGDRESKIKERMN